MKYFKYLAISLMMILVVGVAYLFLRPSHFVSKDEAIAVAALPESDFLQWNGRDVHYIEKGEGDPILLVHGLGGSVFDWEDLFYLLAEDYRVIAVDLPGFSLSDSPDMSLFNETDYLKMYRAFMKDFMEVKDLDSFHLVGNSMGGWMAWETAVLHPSKLRSLSLLAPAGHEMEKIADKNTAWLKNPVTKIVLAKGLPKSVTELNLGFCYANDSLIEQDEIDRRHVVSNKEGNLDWMKRIGLSSEFTDTALIAKVKTPTLIIWGDKDEIITYEHAAKFHRDIEGSTLITYENGGHTPQMEVTEKVYGDLVPFFEANGDF